MIKFKGGAKIKLAEASAYLAGVALAFRQSGQAFGVEPRKRLKLVTSLWSFLKF